MKNTTLCLVLCLFAAEALAQEPRELDSSITEVTVYPSSARVLRRARVDGDGVYLLRGLPGELEPDSVRVRLKGGFVAGVEVQRRVVDQSPLERIEKLRATRQRLARRLEEGYGSMTVLEQRGKHLDVLLASTARAQRLALAEGRVEIAAWQARQRFIADSMRTNRRLRRDLQWTQEDLEAERIALDLDLEGHIGRTAVPIHDVLVKVAGSARAQDLEVAYIVGRAGWRPLYDIRCDAAGKRVTLVYRGEISQVSGEDWQGVRLLLSSAQPERSARGPDLLQLWASLFDPRRATGADGSSIRASLEVALESEPALSSLGYSGGADDGYSQVLEEGLSVRFVVPGTDSVESGGSSTTVEVGKQELAVRTEYFCVPRQDTTVWLRGHAKNEGRWPILAGSASVFFGEDYLGQAELGEIAVGQRFSMPLGAADGITCERIKTADFLEGASFFSGTATETEAWRLTFANQGSAIHSGDGSVRVVVREALPRPTDDGVEVKLTGLSHAPSKAERWRKDAEEFSFQTWELQVPLHGETELRFAITVEHPESQPVSYREGGTQ